MVLGRYRRLVVKVEAVDSFIGSVVKDSYFGGGWFDRYLHQPASGSTLGPRGTEEPRRESVFLLSLSATVLLAGDT
jgi:hypothetical protein